MLQWHCVGVAVLLHFDKDATSAWYREGGFVLVEEFHSLHSAAQELLDQFARPRESFCRTEARRVSSAAARPARWRKGGRGGRSDDRGVR
jgi:hypothetical protein